MLEPWNDPGYVKRAWCLFELYTSIQHVRCPLSFLSPLRPLLRFVSKRKDRPLRVHLEIGRAMHTGTCPLTRTHMPRLAVAFTAL